MRLDRLEWISVQKHGNRLCPPFTNTGTSLNESKEPETVPSNNLSVPVIEIMDIDDDDTHATLSDSKPSHTPSQQPVVTTISMKEICWKFSLTQGDLVDAKDPSGVWYQVSSLCASDNVS